MSYCKFRLIWFIFSLPVVFSLVPYNQIYSDEIDKNYIWAVMENLRGIVNTSESFFSELDFHLIRKVPEIRSKTGKVLNAYDEEQRWHYKYYFLNDMMWRYEEEGYVYKNGIKLTKGHSQSVRIKTPQKGIIFGKGWARIVEVDDPIIATWGGLIKERGDPFFHLRGICRNIKLSDVTSASHKGNNLIIIFGKSSDEKRETLVLYMDENKGLMPVKIEGKVIRPSRKTRVIWTYEWIQTDDKSWAPRKVTFKSLSTDSNLNEEYTMDIKKFKFVSGFPGDIFEPVFAVGTRVFDARIGVSFVVGGRASERNELFEEIMKRTGDINGTKSLREQPERGKGDRYPALHEDGGKQALREKDVNIKIKGEKESWTTYLNPNSVEPECGPHALLAVLKCFGIDASPRELYQLTGLTNNGTTFSNLIRAAEQKGLVVLAVRVRHEEIEKIRGLGTNAFAIARVKHYPFDFTYNHFVAVCGIDRISKRICIIDYPDAPIWIDLAKFNNLWDGNLLVFRRRWTYDGVIMNLKKNRHYVIGIVTAGGFLLGVMLIIKLKRSHLPEISLERR